VNPSHSDKDCTGSYYLSCHESTGASSYPISVLLGSARDVFPSSGGAAKTISGAESGSRRRSARELVILSRIGHPRGSVSNQNCGAIGNLPTLPSSSPLRSTCGGERRNGGPLASQESSAAKGRGEASSTALETGAAFESRLCPQGDLARARRKRESPNAGQCRGRFFGRGKKKSSNKPAPERVSGEVRIKKR